MINNITLRQIRKIKVLARQVFGNDDGAYREMLWGQAKVQSCKDLKGPQIDLVIRHLERSLRPVSSEQSAVSSKRTAGGDACATRGARPLRATAEQLDEIRRRWDSLSLAQPWEREGALRKFLQRRFHVAAPEWLTLAEAQKVLNGLKAMGKRQGPVVNGQGPVKAEG